MTNNKKFIGIPFKHNGRSFEEIDCIGLVELYLNEHNIELTAQDGKQINKKWYLEDPQRLIQGVRNKCNSINYIDRKKFDIVVFKFSGIASHIGVMINRNKFLHIFEGRKSGISKIKKWKNKLVGIYRVGDN